MIRVGVLTDDVLLEIFDFYVRYGEEGWQSLIHVCRRWRSLVLESPRRLNLQLLCTPKTPTRDKLGVWPTLPIIVAGSLGILSYTGNIIAALEQSHRVCRVSLGHLARWQSQKVLAAMQVPFPELTYLRLSSNDETTPVIPDSFLGGISPRLQFFELVGIPFPGLPKHLLSATQLVQLRLSRIPDSGYISPEAMVTLLSALSSLERLSLAFKSPRSRPDGVSRSPPPSERSILPALEYFQFNGVIDYLEDFVTNIDSPQLDTLQITISNQIDFDCPRLAQFVNCTPKLGKHDEAHVKFGDRSVRFLFGTLEIFIPSTEPDRRLSSLARVCSSALPSTVEDLYIERQYSSIVWKNDATENNLWLQLLLPFTAVKNLYLSKEFGPGIAPALQELVGSRKIEVLPSLQDIFVEDLPPSGPLQENIGQFVAARQLTISVWDKDSNTKLM